MSLRISLTPEQVEQRFLKLGIPYHFSAEERASLSTTPIVNADGDVFAFPTPRDNAALTLLGIRDIVGSDPGHQPAIFDHPWYTDEAFMKTSCAPGWHFLSMDVLPDSVGQSINYKDRLVSRGLELPSAIEVTLMLFLHYAETNEQLLLRKHTWCSDTASLGRHVTVGAFGRNGLFVSGHPMGFASRGLGICAKVNR